MILNVEFCTDQWDKNLITIDTAFSTKFYAATAYFGPKFVEEILKLMQNFATK